MTKVVYGGKALHLPGVSLVKNSETKAPEPDISFKKLSFLRVALFLLVLVPAGVWLYWLPRLKEWQAEQKPIQPKDPGYTLTENPFLSMENTLATVGFITIVAIILFMLSVDKLAVAGMIAMLMIGAQCFLMFQYAAAQQDSAPSFQKWAIAKYKLVAIENYDLSKYKTQVAARKYDGTPTTYQVHRVDSTVYLYQSQEELKGILDSVSNPAKP